jgi:hypothetical protein
VTDGRGERPASGFLSEEWFAALETKVASAAARNIDDDGAPAPLRLGIRMTGVPWAADGRFAYTIVMAEDSAVVVGDDEAADAFLVATYEAARDLATGKRTAGELLEGGFIKVGGNVTRLLSAADALQASLLHGERARPDDGQRPAPAVNGAPER